MPAPFSAAELETQWNLVQTQEIWGPAFTSLLGMLAANAEHSVGQAEDAEASALASAASAQAAAALAATFNLPSIGGNGSKILQVNSGGSAWVFSTLAQLLGLAGHGDKYLRVTPAGDALAFEALTPGRGSFAGLNLGWGSASSITLDAGAIEINGVEYSNAAINKSMSGLGNNTLYYVYAQAPASGTTITATEITVAIAAPTYDLAKRGWYDATGNKRCLIEESKRFWAFFTDGSGNAVPFTAKDGLYLYGASFVDLNNGTPSNIWTDVTLTVPPGKTAICQIVTEYSNLNTNVFYRPKGSTGAGSKVRTTYATAPITDAPSLFHTDSASKIQICEGGATANKVTINTNGFKH